MNDTVLAPQEVADRALSLLLECIEQPLRTDVTARREPQERGGIIEVRDPHSGEIYKVTLDSIADASFAMTSDDMRKPIDEFAAEFLVPAAMVIAKQIDQSVLESPIFGSAPLPLSVGAITGATQMRGGISLRATLIYDIRHMCMVYTLDVLYGVTPDGA